MKNTILVTGGAGFIGSNFIHQWFAAEAGEIVNLDRLTYAGNLANLDGLRHGDRHRLVHGDISDAKLVNDILSIHRPRAIVHFAAESHVDRSIHSPQHFIETNVGGTFQLLHAVSSYWMTLSATDRERFRFLHISTDEVYGSLDGDALPFCENSVYAPNSPYAASKASSDHFVRAYHQTFGLPTLVINCSNNYGPRQFPEKLIPLMILNALQEKPLPVYGDGLNIRDWLYVEDHCEAIRTVLGGGIPGETYNVGGRAERTNLEVVKTIRAILQEFFPENECRSKITHIKDRPGHDRRYAINCGKIERELGWRPRETFETGIRKTVRWYVDNPDWIDKATSGAYQQWIAKNYESRG